MKHYEKPQLFMEEFTMCESIARCGANHPGDFEDSLKSEWGVNEIITNHWADSCNAIFDSEWLGHYNVFVSNACEQKYGENDEVEFVCYQGSPSGGYQLFHS